jgi:hypothetical protein
MSAQPRPESDSAGEATPETEEQEAVPMNRAERRAHAKGKKEPVIPPKVHGSSKPAATHRQWSNRRSGG